ncbi:ABC transporter ATP-binding protein [Thermophilibacter provencensis]|uniref:ABC transporter ATP-binding protein/permease n=1 Tax=Thermophilibacter provencensis TaxID=1852386 RepID=A0A921GFT5_9ACTN|nr:ABC transporter ATP-binding protein [Thermophilibacter provencensis]HJF45486.1 ABC transporter ATP-binding protein/permease [Thermophilibacter provencensis]
MKKKKEGQGLTGREVIGTLKGSIREFKGASIATPIIVSGEVVMEVAIPFVTAQLINSIQAGATLGEMLPYAGVLVAMALASLCFGIGAGVTCSQASCGLAMNLRHDVFAAVQRFSFANIDQFSSSSLVTRLTTDITNVQLAYMMIIRTAIRCPFLLLAGIVMAFIMAGPLALVFVVIVPILGFGLYKVVRTVHPIFRSVFHKYDALNESIEENVTGMRDVKSYVRQDYEKEKFGRAAQDVCADFTRAEKILALNTPMMNFAVYTVFAVTLQFGSYLIISSQGTLLNVGQLSALTTYGFMILMALMMVSMVFAMITMAQESAERICEVLRTEPTIKNPAHPETEMRDGSIDFDNVTFKYSEKAEHRALAEIDLHIKSGETIGVMGGTGSAKTSLVNLISRLYDVTEGSVKVGGVDVRDYDLEFLRNNVAVVLQKNVLFLGTIKENLRWGNPDATYDELVEVCRLAQADEFIQQLPKKYDYYIEQGGTNVSGGQKQRLCIARALLKHPKVLILDDSTSAVDTKTDALIREGLKSYLPEATKIIIAQRVSSVQDADRILVLDNGHVAGLGTHEELLESCPFYRDTYLAQNRTSQEAEKDDDAAADVAPTKGGEADGR